MMRHMQLRTAHDAEKPSPSRRKPYRPPALRVFGSVTAITASLNKDGQLKDGGPNNLKT
jgi:hypothetical protein